MWRPMCDCGRTAQRVCSRCGKSRCINCVETDAEDFIVCKDCLALEAAMAEADELTNCGAHAPSSK